MSISLALLFLGNQGVCGSCIIEGAIDNGGFECTYTEGGYARPCKWDYEDYTTGHNDVHSLKVSDPTGSWDHYDPPSDDMKIARS